MRRPKITIVGAGNVGATCAHWVVAKELGDVVMVDIPDKENMAKGKALDLAECGPVERFDANILGTSNYADTADSDVVVVTAGLPRKPGMSRSDLINTNVKIVRSVCEQIVKYSPNTILVVVSNPLDAMVYTAWKTTGLPTSRVVGQSGCLDMARYRTFIAMELDVSVEDINALLMGGHGDDMVPLPRYTSVAGIPVTQLIGPGRLNEIIERTKMGGGEIVQLMGTSAFYAPAAGSIQMVEAIVKNKKRILPCAAFCDREYGAGGYFVGVPCVLGSGGVEKIIEVSLDPQERALFDKSLTSVRELSELAQKAMDA